MRFDTEQAARYVSQFSHTLQNSDISQLSQFSRTPIAAIFLPIAFLGTGFLSAICTPPKHTLLVTAIAWILVAVGYTIRLRVSGAWGNIDAKRLKLSCSAGALYALAQLCERASADETTFWWTKALLPLLVYALLRLDLPGFNDRPLAVNSDKHSIDATGSLKSHLFNPTRLVLLTTCCGIVALRTTWIDAGTIALGLSSALLTTASILLLEHTFRHPRDARETSDLREGPGARPRAQSLGNVQESRSVKRDFALTVGILCLLSSVCMESFRSDGMNYREPPSQNDVWDRSWRERQPAWRTDENKRAIWTETGRAFLMLNFLQISGPLKVALVATASTIFASFALDVTALGMWPLSLYATAAVLMLDDVYPLSIVPSIRLRHRARHVFAICFIVGILFILIGSTRWRSLPMFNSSPVSDPLFPAEYPIEEMGPLPLVDNTQHPIEQLLSRAKKGFEAKLSSQSPTLQDAVTQYRRRYRIPPPPKFDVWFEHAKRKGVVMMDEYDNVHEMLSPFWSLSPRTIRDRTVEALGYKKNFLIAVLIREGAIVKFEGGDDWQQQAIMGMMADYVHHLPDMDLAFNIHDEPRVILPYDTLSSMMRVAQEKQNMLANSKKHFKNMFSSRPSDMSDGRRLKEVKKTRFNVFAHQGTWTHSRSSCPPTSPSRSWQENPKDNVTAFALTNLGFIYNSTAFADICMSPSLSSTYGFFDRPNAYNIIQELFPIFSQSKLSSYQDIIYPSPWYWAGKVGYDANRDPDWTAKNDSLYWRGSTTGGFSRDGGWRRQHRQHIVRKINEPSTAKILVNTKANAVQSIESTAERTEEWIEKRVNRKDHAELTDVKFSHVGQCDPADCAAQKEYFNVVDRVDQQEAWSFKHLLDMDGNAFSGRFYAFLRSNSLVYKMNLFQEWHRDLLIPWLHFIPFSLKGEDWLEIIRWFSTEDKGKKEAERLASVSKDWASRVLRNEDLEVWFFRLLLEYGRLIDDNRDIVGYSGP